MLLCCTDSNPELEQEYVTMAQQNKVDGIIGLTYNPNLIVEEQTPFVSIDRSMGPKIPCVASDNFAGGQLAAERLASCGCKNVAFMRIGSSLDNEPNKRKAGFENGCLIHGLNYEMKILNDGDSFDEFEVFLREHLHEGKLDFDGIFCITDRIAYHIMRILYRLNLKIPDDVQIIGFDGIRSLDDEFLCSTIVQPVEEIAQMCVDLLLQENMTTKPPLVCLPVTYVPFRTTSDYI
jgi:LacI family transcriptional regulator